MKAIIFDEAGEPSSVLRVAEASVPMRDDGAALVAVDARPLQPADMAFIRGRYRLQPNFPQVAGLEGAGRIVDPGATGFAAGMRVAFRAPGSWAAQVAVPADRLIAVPDDIPDDAACQISLNPLTALGLLDTAGVAPGDTVLITAAASTVARIVTAICRVRGIATIGIVRTAASAALATTDATFAANDPDLIDKLHGQTRAAPPAALLDSVGGPLVANLMPLLQPGARIVAYGVMDPAPTSVTNAALIYQNLTWIGFGIDRWLGTLPTARRAELVDQLCAMLRDGSLQLPVAARFPLDDIQDALRADAAPGRSGKIILTS
ncbi:MAG: zinc-binding dehydrogenase [Pseudomonadota bacterium]